MSEKRYQYERIESYIKGEMTSYEKSRFEMDLKSDAFLEENFKTQLLEHEAMELIVAESLRNKFKVWQDHPPEDPLNGNHKRNHVRQILNGSKLYIFGLIFLSALSIILYKWNKNNLSNINHLGFFQTIDSTQIHDLDSFPPNIQSTDKFDDIKDDSIPKINKSKRFTESKDKEREHGNSFRNDLAYIQTAQEFYVEPEFFSTMLRSGKLEINDIYSIAVERFQDRDYQKALDLLLDIDILDNSDAQFLLGNIYFNLQRYNDASIIFAKMIEDPILPQYEDARWYLFLSYTALLPNSNSIWEELYKDLEFDSDFIYRNELENLLLKINLLK